MKMTMTHHASRDRYERLCALIDYLGMDEIVLEVPDYANEGANLCLTRSGIIIVRGVADNVVITAYMASVNCVYAMYKQAGYQRIPKKLFNRICEINVKYAFLKNL